MVGSATFVLLVGLLSYLATADELLLVHAIWRHGDRSPVMICKNDVQNKNPTWRQGFGQLTALGLQQLYDLGSMTYDEYVTKQHFLSETYKSDEIYVRSTDTNRTIMSAMANMMGMYSNRPASQGLFPTDSTWPEGFVPIPVHTVAKETDHVGLPGRKCSRLNYLYKKMAQCKDVIDYEESVQEDLADLSKVCGDTLGLFSVWYPLTAQKSENVHNRRTLFTAQQYEKMNEINNVAIDFHEAISLSQCDDIHLNVEIPKIRGGPMLSDIIDRLELKIKCQQQPAHANSEECTWINGLKYYAYSMHEDTLAALISALGAKQWLLPHGYPQFSSAITLELWNTANGSQIKMKFRGDDTQMQFTDVTSFIGDCALSGGYCPFESFKQRSVRYNPGDITEYCADVPPEEMVEAVEVQDPEDSVPDGDTGDSDDGSGQQEVPQEDQLILLQAVWRDGDRTPKWVCKNDPNKGSTWTGGLGDLTPTGMSQQRELGDLIFNEYAVKQHFLSEHYLAREIYLRSTDVNRTLLSAVSNLVGMYFNRSEERAGLDYPSTRGWPSGYVPIPVHTIQKSTDHLSEESLCPRRDELMELIMNSAEVKNFEGQDKNKQTLESASAICGEQLDVLKVSDAVDACESEVAAGKSCLFNGTLLEEMKLISSVGQDLKMGELNSSMIYGVDVTSEMARIRGGSILWDIIYRMDQKLECANYSSLEFCHWTNHLRYYAYSGDDSTLQSLMSALGNRKAMAPSGTPQYAAAMVFELWKTARGAVVKVKYNDGHSTNTLRDVTNTVSGCPNTGECLLGEFMRRSTPYHPGDFSKLCNGPLDLDIPDQTMNTTLSTLITST